MFNSQEENEGVQYVFAPSELDYIASILRGAFAIRTADGEEDILLGDFISALEEADCICCDEDLDTDDENDDVITFY